MDNQVQLKLQFGDAIRRTSVASGESLAGLKRSVCSFLGLDGCHITYVDEENDVITIGSDIELRQLLSAALADRRTVRFIIAPDSSPVDDEMADEEQQEEAEEEEPDSDFPFKNLASAMADPEVVQRVQAVFQSPVITEAATKFARAYSDSKGDVGIAGLVSAQHIPALLGVLAELVHEVPVLSDLQDLFIRAAFSGENQGPPWMEMLRRGRGGCGQRGRGCHRGGRHGSCHPGHHGGHHHPGHHGEHHHFPGHHGFPGHHHPGHHHAPGHGGHHHHPGHGGHHHHHPGHGDHPWANPWARGGMEGEGLRGQGHPGVFCDGCSSDPKLKQASIEAGKTTRRGFIRGLRFKSQSMHDFDLCEECVKDEARKAAYGPFTEIAPQEGRGGKRFWGWQNRCQQMPAGGNPWRAQQQASESSASTADLVGTFRSMMEKGSEILAQSEETSELSQVTRAIAESLKGGQEAEQASKPVAEAAEDPFIKWAPQLKQLELLGFDKLETYFGFLKEENGDLERVVNRIVRRDM